MAVRYTKEQLNALDKELLIQMFLNQQEQLLSIDRKLQLLLEQVAVLNHRRFGRSSEKLAVDDQIAFMEVDGRSYFLMKRKQSRHLQKMGNQSPPRPGRKRPGGNGNRTSKISRLYP